MARKFESMIVMLSYSAFLLILFQVAADNHSDLNVYGEVASDNSQWSYPDELTLDRDTSTPRRELQGVVSVVKGLFKVYRIWNKSKQAYEVVSWTISEVHDYIDGQCQAEFYCCKNNLFLDCKSCCDGIRPDTAPSSAPSPSPLPSPETPLISQILLSTFVGLYVLHVWIARFYGLELSSTCCLGESIY